MRLSPSRAAAALSAAALATTLAACSGSSDATSSSGSTGAATHAVKSTFTGTTVEVPEHPKRVVALWRTGSELADMGVVPVATLEGEMLETELGSDTFAKVKDLPTVGTFEGVDLEKVIAAKPDLIVGMDNGGLKIDYDELSKVAPTVVLKIAEPTDVWDNYTALADVVGRSTDYDAREKKIDAELADLKKTYGDTLGALQVTDFSSSQGTIWVETSKSLSYRRISAAGFGYNPTYTKAPERYVTELAAENLPDLADQDAIFYEVNLDGTVPTDVQAVLDSASFKRLPAAEAGHVFPLTSGIVYTFDAAEKQVADLQAAAEKLAADA
ncbi:ABC transporter substrate-binding protein [Luteimicrobium xylanilyticum]|uniref:Fe/B12 periplasmic-binding domain-containing protein n=1 Tax=Luteimicrobium xylanilyticum TaxID=1133546 RepID=A0A5P9QAM2_9MICO|nr:ABC transporter substrate-binding protein [Luteimicrobium xylanilyticum]QFU98409.1 hypothetical protein KDY119_01921 [Luteimicrobium xylanilyticum]